MKTTEPITFDTVRGLAAALPETTEKVCYGTPGLYVRNNFFARLLEDGDTLVVKSDMSERDHWMHANPAAFFVTDHYRDSRYMLVRLSVVSLADVRTLLTQSWRMAAPKRLSASFSGE